MNVLKQLHFQIIDKRFGNFNSGIF